MIIALIYLFEHLLPCLCSIHVIKKYIIEKPSVSGINFCTKIMVQKMGIWVPASRRMEAGWVFEEWVPVENQRLAFGTKK